MSNAIDIFNFGRKHEQRPEDTHTTVTPLPPRINLTPRQEQDAEIIIPSTKGIGHWKIKSMAKRSRPLFCDFDLHWQYESMHMMSHNKCITIPSIQDAKRIVAALNAIIEQQEAYLEEDQP